MFAVAIADVAIIGGTGIGARLAALGGVVTHVPTRKGTIRGSVLESRGVRIFAVQRHSAGHSVPPHAVPYGAIGLSFAAMGVRACLATAAVGSVRADLTPGTLLRCTDFLDLTGRKLTMYDNVARHTDFSRPFDPRLNEALSESARALEMPLGERCVYAGMNGPRYETPAEVEMIRRLGADVAGMTATSEATVMRELGIAYGCVAIVSNLAAGLQQELSHGEVLSAMDRVGSSVVDLLLGAAELLAREAARG